LKRSETILEGDELMTTMTYTNAQLRSILNGLGYTTVDETVDTIFPRSMDDRPLTNPSFVRAIEKFQIEHQLEVSGIIDPATLCAIQTMMHTFISNLNRANPYARLDNPVYDAATIAAVKLVQQRLPNDGVASSYFQYELAKPENVGVVSYPVPSPAHTIFLSQGDNVW
jgi:murein L,D-transpeptidase YcbB/YkuD